MAQEFRDAEEDKTQKRAQILGLQYIDTSNANRAPLYPKILPVPDLYSLKVIPIIADKSHILFGVTNMTSQQVMKQLQQRFQDQRISFGLISDAGFADFMKRYDPPPEVTYQDIKIRPTELQVQPELSSISNLLMSVKADDMFAYLIKQAYQLKASDIHLETGKDSVRIRFRVDGVLHPIAEVPHDKYKLLLGSLASAANISTVAPEPQTSHIERTYKLADGSSVTMNLRVETVPTVHGQDAVLRLFNYKSEFLKLDSLGFAPHERAIIDEILTHPNGLVLIVGPTGSGKTTTLYSIISELNHTERKIITLEDPVEYVIKGITQIPVDSRSEKDGFNEKLRAVLRLDPDVIMVGEIRDNDTAKTALQSSLTGHLVLSTYHAASSATALTRMLDAVGENPLLINTIRLITSQRLVRRLDDKTKESYAPDPAIMEQIKKVIETLPPSVEKPSLSNVTLYKPGKSEENPFGYNGQIALRELMQINEELQQLLRKPSNEVSASALEQAAIRGGMITMLQDGILKALRGETTLEEVYRVVG